jgi:sugar transferase EpsL
MTRRVGLAAKRGLDIVGAAGLLLLTSPLTLAAALAVRVTMGRPVLFRDLRAGRRAKPFALLKLRTMRPLRPDERVPDDDAARLTRVGRWLRATSVDELPSLVNVLVGQMSLVGPRPLPLRYVARFTPRQSRRFEVRPGVTGLAQVEGRNALLWEDKLELDAWYAEHRTLWLDLRILARTPRSVLGRDGVRHAGHATMPEFTGANCRRTNQ